MVLDGSTRKISGCYSFILPINLVTDSDNGDFYPVRRASPHVVPQRRKARLIVLEGKFGLRALVRSFASVRSDFLLNKVHIRDPGHEALGLKVVVENRVGKVGIGGRMLQRGGGRRREAFQHQVIPLTGPAAVVLPETIEYRRRPSSIETA